MRYWIGLLFLLIAFPAHALTLTWQDNSNNESGFAIEMLVKGVFAEVARVGANVTTFVDTNTEGVYRVRAFISIAGQPDVFSLYSNTGAVLNAPVNLLAK